MKETKENKEACIAVIQNNISFIQKDISNINSNLKELSSVFARKEALEAITKETETRFNKLEQADNWTKYLMPIFYSVSSAILTFLFINYLQNIK